MFKSFVDAPGVAGGVHDLETVKAGYLRWCSCAFFPVLYLAQGMLKSIEEVGFGHLIILQFKPSLIIFQIIIGVTIPAKDIPVAIC